MLISTKGRYALRVMIDLAEQDREGWRQRTFCQFQNTAYRVTLRLSAQPIAAAPSPLRLHKTRFAQNRNDTLQIFQ